MTMEELTRKMRNLITPSRKDPDKVGISQKDLNNWLKPAIMQKIVKEAGAGKMTAEILVAIASKEIEEPKNSQTKIPSVHFNVTSDSYSMNASKGMLLFGIGSLIKLLINVCLYRMIEHGSEILEKVEKGNLDIEFSAEISHILEEAWGKEAFSVLDALRAARRPKNGNKSPEEDDIAISTERQAETQNLSTSDSIEYPNADFLLKNILRHNGFASMYEHMLAPNSDLLMSIEEYEKCIGPLTNFHKASQREWKYSNYNHILACLIIREASNRSLADTLKLVVLDEFAMDNTFLHIEEFEKMLKQNAQSVAKPHVLGISGICYGLDPNEYPPCFVDDASLAVLGGYSCTRDFGRLFRVLLSGIWNKNSKWAAFWRSEGRNSSGDWGSHFAGISCHTNSTAIEFQALDPTRSISDEVKTFSLGKPKFNPEKIKVAVKGGAVKGYNCHYFLIPFLRTFIIVFTNGSGIIDASNYIGQYILKQILQTEDKIDFMIEPSRICLQRKAVLQVSMLNPDKRSAFDETQLQGFAGTYRNETTTQTITITAGSVNGDLEIVIQSGLRSTRKGTLRLIKISDSIMRIAPRRERDYGPDTYVWWSFNLEFKYEANNQILVVASVDPSKPETIYNRVKH
jgi:hypothetical protein